MEGWKAKCDTPSTWPDPGRSGYVPAGATIVLVATGLFGLAWLLAPDHGLIATRLARHGWRRRETSTARCFEVGVIEIPGHK
jgi:hypothetical protein